MTSREEDGVNSLIIGHPGSLVRFLARSLVLPTIVCGTLWGVLAGAQFLGAELPDGTVHVQTSR